jgi:DNA replication protein DnaC
MERHKILEMMGELKLAGSAAFDEVLTNGVKRQHSVQQIVGDLLAAEIAEKQARSIRYQVAAAKLPLAKELADFEFTGSPINEALVRDLASGTFLTQQRNAVLVGGTGTGKSHLACHRPSLHPRRRPLSVLHRCRPGQPARSRGQGRARRTHCRHADPSRSHRTG